MKNPITSSNREPKKREQTASIPRKRLRAINREQQIIDGAVAFFAERGFSGQTRELASRLGITQPLLYRYFPTKRDLIERVFSEVYLNRVDPSWTEVIKDRSRPLQDRLCDFYTAYASVTHRYEWIRIYMFSALMGEELNRRYIRIVEEKILTPIATELRDYCGLPTMDDVPISKLDLEHIWVMHGGLFYYAVRKYIYGERVSENLPEVISTSVSVMLAGSEAIADKLLTGDSTQDVKEEK